MKNFSDIVPDFQVPTAIDAENNLLASMLLDPDVLTEFTERMEPKDFYRDSNRVIFETLVEMSRAGISAQLIAKELERQSKTQAAGGAAYVHSLFDLVASAGYAEYYADKVCDAATKRSLVTAGVKMLRLSQSVDKDVDELCEVAETEVYRLGRKRELAREIIPSPTVYNNFMAYAAQQAENPGKLVGLPSGYTGLDQALGGLRPGQLVVVAARPSMGKSAWTSQIGFNVAASGHKTLLYSMEMPLLETTGRLIAASTGIPLRVLEGGVYSPVQKKLIDETGEVMSSIPLGFSVGTLTPAKLRGDLRRSMGSGGVRLVVIDYLQLMNSDKKTENRTQEVSQIARDLKDIALEFNITVMVLSQLSRACERRENQRPMLSDLRESGEIEAAADCVVFLYREQYYAQQRGEDVDPTQQQEVEILISKGRSSGTGSFRIGFIPALTRFCDLDDDATGF